MDHEFYFNLNNKTATWEMPDEIGQLVVQLMAEAMGVPEECDEDGGLETAENEEGVDGEGGPGTKRKIEEEKKKREKVMRRELKWRKGKEDESQLPPTHVGND